jgi:ERF superfamily
MTTDITLLAKSLAKFQSECPKITLSKQVSVLTKAGGTYTFNYAELSHIIEITRPFLVKHGLSVSQPLQEDGTVLTLLIHESGQYIESKLKITGETTPQGIGSAITYARRYSYTSILGIVAESDDDGNGAAGNNYTSGKPGEQLSIPNTPAAQPKPQRTNLPWLDMEDRQGNDTKAWRNVKVKISDGTITSLKQIENFYRINKDTKNAILDIFASLTKK